MKVHKCVESKRLERVFSVVCELNDVYDFFAFLICLESQDKTSFILAEFCLFDSCDLIKNQVDMFLILCPQIHDFDQEMFVWFSREEDDRVETKHPVFFMS